VHNNAVRATCTAREASDSQKPDYGGKSSNFQAFCSR